jgi:hypothetical protein
MEHRQLISAIIAADYHYGAERFEAKYFPSGSEFYSNIITIHYPSVVISDGKLSTRVFDLYVKIYLSYDGSIRNIQGTTLTRTIAQYNSYYAHSHVSKTQDTNFSSFCLGDCKLSSLKSQSVAGDWDRDDWCLFYEALDNYLTQEGSPYIRLSTIGLVNGSDITSEGISMINGSIKRFIEINILDDNDFLHKHLIIDNSILDAFSFKRQKECSFDEEFIDLFLEYMFSKNTRDTLLHNNIIGIYNPLKGYGEPKVSGDIDEPYFLEEKSIIFKEEKKVLMIVPNDYPSIKEVNESEEPEYYFTKTALIAIKNYSNRIFKEGYDKYTKLYNKQNQSKRKD